MMGILKRACWATGLLLSAGCFGDVAVFGSDGDGGRGAHQTAGGGGAGAGHHAGGSGDGDGGDSSNGGNGGALTCPEFRDAPADPVTLRFVNKTGLPIYLPTTCGSLRYTLQANGSPDDISYPAHDFCLQTCAELQTEPQYACGACAPSSILLPGDATRDFTWSGTGLKHLSMPAQCWYQQQRRGECSQLVAAQPGTYQTQARGWSSCGAQCTCNADGICNGEPTGLEARAISANIAYPAQHLVEVVFGVCAFGCGGG